MKIQVKRCKVCGALGVGPAKVRLSPLGGSLWCDAHWRDALAWEVSREAVVSGIKRELTIYKKAKVKKAKPIKWSPYLAELCGMAEIAFANGDRRTFVHYFARALYAWDLKERSDAQV